MRLLRKTPEADSFIGAICSLREFRAMRIKDLRSEAMKHWDLIALLILISFGLASIRTFFEDGMLVSWDHPVNLVNCYYAARSILSGGDMLFYDTFNNLGWVVNHNDGPGSQLLVVFVHAITGFKDIVISYKLGVAIAYVAMAPAIYVMTRAFTGSKLAAVASAFSSIVVTRGESPWYDAGLLQLYEAGMWPQRLGIAFALTSIGFLAFGLRHDYRLSKRLFLASLSALFMAAAIVTHAMTGVGLAIVFVILLMFFEASSLASPSEGAGRRERLIKKLEALGKDLLSFALAFALGIGLSSSWIFGYLETTGYRPLPIYSLSVGPSIYPEPFYSMDPLLVLLGLIAVSASIASCRSKSGALVAAISLGSFFLLQLLTVLNLSDGFLGIRVLYSALLLLIAAGAVKRAHALALMASSILILYLATGPSTYTIMLPGVTVELGKLIPFLRGLEYARLSALARFLLIALSAEGFAMCSRFLYGQVSGPEGKERKYGYLAGLVLGVFVFAYLNTQVSTQISRTDIFTLSSQDRRFKLEGNFTLVQNLRKVFDWIAREMPMNTRALYQDTLTDLGDWKAMPVSHYVYLSSYLTGKPSLGGVYETHYVSQVFAYTGGSTIFSDRTSSVARDVKKFYEMTGELGVTYVVLFDPDLVSALSEGSLFERVYEAPPIYVFRRTEFAPIAYIESEGSVGRVNSFKVDVNNIEVGIEGAGPGSDLVIRVVNYPGWEATVNGKAVKVESTYANLPSVYRIEGQLLYNIKVPYMKVRLQEGDNTVNLKFDFRTSGDMVTMASAAALLGIDSVYFVTVLRAIRTRKSPKAS